MRAFIIIQNLKCNDCVNSITKKLTEIENITNVEIDIEDSKVYFDYNQEEALHAVQLKLKEIGYPSIDEANRLLYKGRSYINCALGKMNTI